MRPNLTVAVNAHVDQILFDQGKDEEPRAIGVLISTSPMSPKYAVRARNEVILSSGAVGSPQLLLLSGVGPAEELSELSIPVVKDLPAVGKNLSDVRRSLWKGYILAPIAYSCLACRVWFYGLPCETWCNLGPSHGRPTGSQRHVQVAHRRKGSPRRSDNSGRRLHPHGRSKVRFL